MAGGGGGVLGGHVLLLLSHVALWHSGGREKHRPPGYCGFGGAATFPGLHRKGRNETRRNRPTFWVACTQVAWATEKETGDCACVTYSNRDKPIVHFSCKCIQIILYRGFQLCVDITKFATGSGPLGFTILHCTLSQAD